MALTTVPASLSATALTLTTAAQPNITSVGTLTGLTVSGNIAGTLTTAAQTNITSVGTLTALTVSGALNGTLSTAAQTNITSVGTLTGLDTTGDITVTKSSPRVRAIESGGATTQIASGGATGYIGTYSNHPLQILSNSTAAITIDTSQNATFAGTISGTLATAAQTNITSVGTLGSLAVNSGTTNISATFTSTDGLGGIKLADDSGNVELVANGNNFEVRNAGGGTKLIIPNSGSATFAAGATFDGNVTIGTTSGSQSLIQMLANSTNGANTIHFGDATSGAASYVGYINYAHDTNQMQFATNGGQVRMRIDSSGRVGIGLTPPAQDFGKYLTVNTANLIGNDTSGGYVGANQYYDGAWKYQVAAGSALISFENDGDVTIRQAASGSANGTITYSENFKVDRATAYIQATGASQVRLTLGSTGTPGTNSANWIRGNSNLLQFNTAGGNYNWEVSGNTKMTLTSSGLFGVGPHTPDAAVHLQGSGHQRLKIESTGSFSDLQFKSGNSTTQWILFLDSDSGNNSGVIKYNHSDNSMRFRTNDVDDRLVIDSNGSATFGGHINSSSSGNITAGAHSYNSSSGVVHYGGTGRTFMDFNYNSYGAEIILLNNRTAGGLASVLQYRTNSTVEGSVRGSASGLEFSNNSDYRKKKDIRDLTGSLDVINSLQPRLYKYREGFGKPARDFVGFVAHEIQEKMPNLVDEEKDAVYTQADIDGGVTDVKVGDPKYQTVSYSANEMITRLVGAIQEQQELIETLQTKVAALEAK